MIVPAYMTYTSSHISATMPKSCVIIRIVVLDVSRSCFISSSTCAWMVTSSAVVGSSAMSSCGPQARPIAMSTRCFMPPENWCG